MGNQKEGQGSDRPETVQSQSFFGLCRHTIHGEWNLIRRPDADSNLPYSRWGTFSERDRSIAGSAWTGDDVRLPIRRNMGEMVRQPQGIGRRSIVGAGWHVALYLYG